MSKEIKPVGYRYKNNYQDAYAMSRRKPIGAWDSIEPVYIKEQLQTRVKMTEDEFDEFKDLHESEVIVSNVFDTMLNNGIYEESSLYKRLFTNDDKKTFDNQNEFTRLWRCCD